jgi:hypothetical protein
MLKKDVVQLALICVVNNERDSSIRIDPQDSARNVFDSRRSQGVNQGPDENPPTYYCYPAFSWHDLVGKLECGLCASEDKGGMQARTCREVFPWAPDLLG